MHPIGKIGSSSQTYWKTASENGAEMCRVHFCDVELAKLAVPKWPTSLNKEKQDSFVMFYTFLVGLPGLFDDWMEEKAEDKGPSLT